MMRELAHRQYVRVPYDNPRCSGHRARSVRSPMVVKDGQLAVLRVLSQSWWRRS